MKNRLHLLILLLGSTSAAFAQVNVIGANVNSTQGYQYQGQAPSNHVLCGNGTHYVDAASCGQAQTVFYQTVQGNGTSLSQESILNFDSNFVVSNTNPSTSVHLASTISVNAATATHVGSADSATNATNASHASTADSATTAGTASALASTPSQCNGTTQIPTGIAANGNANCVTLPIKQLATVNGGGTCETSGGTGTQCTSTYSWAVPFSAGDTNYVPTCTGGPINGNGGTPGATLTIDGWTNSTITIRVTSNTSAHNSFDSMFCTAIHN
jgi:hypothetical protein